MIGSWPWYLEPHLIGLLFSGILIFLMLRYDDEIMWFVDRVEVLSKVGRSRQKEPTEVVHESTHFASATCSENGYTALLDDSDKLRCTACFQEIKYGRHVSPTFRKSEKKIAEAMAILEAL